MHLIVTTIDEPYLPGLIALHNSFLKNSADGFDFAALTFGSEELARTVESRGIRVIADPPFPISELPKGKHHFDPTRLPAMYGRLLVPRLFGEYRRIIYLDADSIILKSLRPLAERTMTKPLAATKCNGPLSYNIHGVPFKGDTGPMSSLLVIDTELWRSFDIDAKWIAAAIDPAAYYPYTVQGVLQRAIELDWHCLPWEYQPHAGHATYFNNRSAAFSLHFMGPNPWEPLLTPTLGNYQEFARKVWESYR